MITMKPLYTYFHFPLTLIFNSIQFYQISTVGKWQRHLKPAPTAGWGDASVTLGDGPRIKGSAEAADKENSSASTTSIVASVAPPQYSILYPVLRLHKQRAPLQF